MNLVEIAQRINTYLQRFEREKLLERNSRSGLYSARAWSSGAWIHIVYVSYQGRYLFRKADAAEYLAWLDAGNIGKHYAMRAQKRAAEAARTPVRE